MEQYFLAIDIGASGGRHILGHLEDGRLVLEEIYRFENGMEEIDGQKCWNVERLFEEIKTGMKLCRRIGKIPVSMGIDTWAVDFVLLDKHGQRLGNAVAYRDRRSLFMDRLVYEKISEEELYHRTGIQKQSFNTIYQLMAVKSGEPVLWEQAETMLMIPDYFHYLLTGRMAAEYSNATTTQLVNADTGDWDSDLIDRLGYKRTLFQKIRQPGTVLGELNEKTAKEVGFSCWVVLPATHDTGSAVAAVPAQKEPFVYISSGTWSLMGTELSKPDCSEESRLHNFTNEGGYEHRYRYLKNIMGLWMIQSVKKELAPEKSYEEICWEAAGSRIGSIVDCNDERFLAPESMIEEVQQACRETKQQVPQGIGQIAAVIYQSLARCYAGTIDELQKQTGCIYEKIHVVGGGANAEYLNELTALETHKTVVAGPVEATAAGNVVIQLLAAGKWKNLTEARACIAESFPIRKYTD